MFSIIAKLVNELLVFYTNKQKTFFYTPSANPCCAAVMIIARATLAVRPNENLLGGLGDGALASQNVRPIIFNGAELGLLLTLSVRV
jgi:hypothetical protein